MDHYVPAARIKNMKEVFETAEARELIVKGQIEGIETSSVKTAVFTIRR